MAKRILGKNLALFLERRVDALHDAPAFLPTVVKDLTNHFMTISRDNSSETRSRFIRDISIVIVTHTPHAVTVALKPNARIMKQYGAESAGCRAMMIAACIGDKRLVEELLLSGTNSWSKSCLSKEHPIYLATRFGNTEVAMTLLSHARTALPGQHLTHFRYKVVPSCILAALQIGKFDLATEMLEWNPYATSCHADALREAIASNAHNFVRKLHRSGHIEATLSFDTWQILDGLLRNPNPETMLRFFTEIGYKGLWDTPCHYDDSKSRKLLEAAVRDTNFSLVAAVVAVRGPLYTIHSATTDEEARRHVAVNRDAFRQAIFMDNLAMVQLFLSNGADLEALWIHDRGFEKLNPNPKRKGTTRELSRPGSKLHAMVQATVDNRIHKLGDKYEAPSYMVYEFDKKGKIRVTHITKSSPV
jgi:hypothetical protein